MPQRRRVREGLAGDVVGIGFGRYTMEQEFYVGRLRTKHGLPVLVPQERDRRIVDSVIYGELCVGVVDNAYRDEYRRIMRDRVSRTLRSGWPHLVSC